MAMKDIEGYEGLYAVTDDGRVWGHKRKQFLKSCPNGRGYYVVTLRGKGKATKSVHRLVAEAFIERLSGKEQVNHIDGDKANNHASNLEWCSSSENSRHSWDNGLQTVSAASRESSKIIGKSTRRMSFDDAQKVRKLYSEQNYTYKELGAMYSVSKDAIGLIIRNQTYLER